MKNSLVGVKRNMRLLLASVSMLLCTAVTATTTNIGVIRYVDARQVGSHVVIVDTRAQALCQQRSIAGAHCLPASDLVGPAGELPSFADIFWALGTAGLDGNETVLVAGDNADERDFVAGILYLCGQANIEILKPAIDKVLQTGKFRTGHGEPRAILRQRIYQATMRDAAMILPGELKRLKRHHPHIRYMDASRLKQDLSLTPDTDKKELQGARHRGWQVIYAASVRSAIAWFTRLIARHDTENKRIRVVPVAVGGLRGYVDRVVL